MCAGNRSQPSLWKDVRRLIPEKSAATSPRKSPSNARPSVHSTGGERGFGSRRRTRRPHRSGAGAGRTRSAEKNAASPPSRGSPAAGAPRPHCAPAPGNTPPPGGGDPARPLPSGASRRLGVLGGPGGVTSEDRAARGAGGRLRVPGKLARASAGRARKVTHRKCPEPSVLRPRPLREKLLRRRRQPPSSS